MPEEMDFLGRPVEKMDTTAKTPTYRQAQKEAMQRGDSGTYFMRKTSKKYSRRSGKKR